MIENIFMNSGKDIRVVAYQKLLSFPLKLNLNHQKKTLHTPLICSEDWWRASQAGVDIGQLWSELMGRWWQPVATPGQSRDPGDSEQWPGAQTRAMASSILGQSPGAPSTVTASVRASEPEMSCWWELAPAPGPECACHHSYPVPSDHPLMGSINTRDHMHKHQHKHWQTLSFSASQDSHNKLGREN